MGGPHGGGLCPKPSYVIGGQLAPGSYTWLSPFAVFLAHFSTDFAEVETCFHLAAHLHGLLITAPLMQYVPQAPELFVLLGLEPYPTVCDLAILRQPCFIAKIPRRYIPKS